MCERQQKCCSDQLCLPMLSCSFGYMLSDNPVAELQHKVVIR